MTTATPATPARPAPNAPPPSPGATAAAPIPVLRELKCPQCSSPIQQHIPDVQTFICPRCHHFLYEGEGGLVATPGSRIPNSRLPVRLGQRVTFGGVGYFILGRVHYKGWDDEESWTWDEWLLGGDDGRLLWLSLDENGLYLYRKLRIREAFDPQTSPSIPIGEGKTAYVSERYPARIMGAEGELTWRAERGEELFMVEGATADRKYSVQVTPAEIEIHEGVKLEADQVRAAFGDVGEEVAQSASGWTLTRQIGVVFLLFAVIGLVAALLVGGSGRRIASQEVTANRTTPTTFPVNFEVAGRPAIVRMNVMSSLPENSFADVDVLVVAPNETETYITFQDFWHETGFDDEGAWREQRLSGGDMFVPALAGQHTIEVMLDEASQLETVSLRIEFLDQAIAPNFLWGYAAIVGVLGLVFIFTGRSSPVKAILIVLGVLAVLALLASSGLNVGDLLNSF